MAHVVSSSPSRSFDIERKQLHLIKKPHGFVSKMACDNLGYQMAQSMEILEGRLAEEGRFFVLQLNMERSGDDWRNPTSWRLYANGCEVAHGSGDFARSCFYDSAECFLEQCAAAIADSGVEPVCEHDYTLLKTAQRIAAAEPLDSGSSALGSKQWRVF